MIYRYGLFREPERGWIAGVAAGLAARFGLTVTVVRLVFVLSALAGTPVLSIVVYAVLAVLIPVRPSLLEGSFRRPRRRET
jgi:phage shock protein PspC (stress-responsive transcriptional regulator)